MHGALSGIAVGGFAAIIVQANIIAVKAFLRFNFMAVQTAWNMHRNLGEAQMNRELQRLQQIIEAQNADDQYEEEES